MRGENWTPCIRNDESRRGNDERRRENDERPPGEATKAGGRPKQPLGHITGCSWNAHETVTDSGNSDDTMTIPRREPPGIPAEAISGERRK